MLSQRQYWNFNNVHFTLLIRNYENFICLSLRQYLHPQEMFKAIGYAVDTLQSVSFSLSVYRRLIIVHINAKCIH